MKTILMALALASLSLSTDALSSTLVSPSRTTTSLVYDQLQATPLYRASDEQPVNLPDLWRSGTPFGVADEVAVCAFLRHFG
jgi:hypothetical protein